MTNDQVNFMLKLNLILNSLSFHYIYAHSKLVIDIIILIYLWIYIDGSKMDSFYYVVSMKYRNKNNRCPIPLKFYFIYSWKQIYL